MHILHIYTYITCNKHENKNLDEHVVSISKWTLTWFSYISNIKNYLKIILFNQ
jgi:hypothetical protein